MVGDIYLAKIFFTDLSEHKIRPVLVIKEMGRDYICLQLTSNLKQNRLIISQDDLSKGNIKKDSLVVVPKNFTLHKSILIKYLATIKEEKLFEIKKIFCQEIDCN
jgi:mRNA-degrading endonuclease toxin of MazEF toxin-antitoxin module